MKRRQEQYSEMTELANKYSRAMACFRRQYIRMIEGKPCRVSHKFWLQVAQDYAIQMRKLMSEK